MKQDNLKDRFSTGWLPRVGLARGEATYRCEAPRERF